MEYQAVDNCCGWLRNGGRWFWRELGAAGRAVGLFACDLGGEVEWRGEEAGRTRERNARRVAGKKRVKWFLGRRDQSPGVAQGSIQHARRRMRSALCAADTAQPRSIVCLVSLRNSN